MVILLYNKTFWRENRTLSLVKLRISKCDEKNTIKVVGFASVRSAFRRAGGGYRNPLKIMSIHSPKMPVRLSTAQTAAAITMRVLTVICAITSIISLHLL
jgi:hypothetical protein